MAISDDAVCSTTFTLGETLVSISSTTYFVLENVESISKKHDNDSNFISSKIRAFNQEEVHDLLKNLISQKKLSKFGSPA